MKSIKYIIVIATLLSCILPSLALAAPALTVTDVELARQTRIDRNVFEYVYKVQVQNIGTAADDVEVSLRNTPEGVTAVRRGTLIPHIDAGATESSNAEIVVRHDRRKPFQFGDLGWALLSRDATFTGRLSGAPDALAISVTQNYVGPPGPRAITTDEEGSDIDLTALEIEFKPDATVAQVNAALNAVGGLIMAMGKDQLAIEVAIPNAGTIDGLNAQIKKLNIAPGVRFSWPSIVRKPLLLPANPPFATPTNPSFYETSPVGIARSSYLHHHLAIRAHGAWNLVGLLESAALKPRRPVMIYQDLFFGTEPDQTINDKTGFFETQSPRLWSTNTNGSDFRLPSNAMGEHGYEVMSVVSGSFGEGKDNTEEGLITGLYPSELETRVVNLAYYEPREADQKLIEIIESYTTKAIAPAQRRNVIVNTSSGECPNDQKCSVIKRIYSAYSTWYFMVGVRQRLLDSQQSPTFLHVYATGNAPEKWAYQDLWGAADASLQLDSAANDPAVDLLHPGGRFAEPGYKHASINKNPVDLTFDDFEILTDRNDKPLVLDRLPNMLGVDARFNTYTQLFTFPGDSGLGVPASTRQIPPAVSCHSWYTSTHGSISGIGGGRAGVDDLWVLNGDLGPAAAGQGTSVASPQVAAIAAWIWSLAPQLSVADVKRLTLATAFSSAQTVGCGDESAYAPSVDVYAAALSTDNPYEPGSPLYKNLGNTTFAPARAWLLDVASVDANGDLVDSPDGKFTQADILKFLQEFEKRQGDQTPDYSRYDLDGNAVTGEPATRQDIIDHSRFDLDGNLQWTYADKEIESIAQRFREDMTTDLEVLVYYAYSPLYQGNEYERTMLLLPYLNSMSAPASLFLSGLNIDVPPRNTTFEISSIIQLGEKFTSLCSSERGTPFYSSVVSAEAAPRTPAGKLYFWQPTQQFGRIQEKPTNSTNCSSFIAAQPGTGLMWINSAARNEDSKTNKDEEYQTRFFLGEPDLAAPPEGSFKPTPRRLATQKLTYGIVPDPGGNFNPLFTSQVFSLSRISFIPAAAP